MPFLKPVNQRSVAMYIHPFIGVLSHPGAGVWCISAILYSHPSVSFHYDSVAEAPAQASFSSYYFHIETVIVCNFHWVIFLHIYSDICGCPHEIAETSCCVVCPVRLGNHFLCVLLDRKVFVLFFVFFETPRLRSQKSSQTFTHHILASLSVLADYFLSAILSKRTLSLRRAQGARASLPQLRDKSSTRVPFTFSAE